MFLSDADFAETAPGLLAALDRELLETFEGWPVRFGDGDRRSRDDIGAGGAAKRPGPPSH